jgi:hypothetical protein
VGGRLRKDLVVLTHDETAAIRGAGLDGGPGGDGLGGGIINFDLPGAPAGRVTVRNSRLNDNLTIGGAGGPGGNGLSGGLYTTIDPACVEDSRVASNMAISGIGAPDGQGGEGIGGRVYIMAASTVGLTRTQVTNNIVSTSHDDIFGDFCEDCAI